MDYIKKQMDNLRNIAEEQNIDFVDVEKEMMDALAKEIVKEIDKQILQKLGRIIYNNKFNISDEMFDNANIWCQEAFGMVLDEDKHTLDDIPDNYKVEFKLKFL